MLGSCVLGGRRLAGRSSSSTQTSLSELLHTRSLPQEAVEMVEKAAASLAAPQERLRKLLG